MSTYDDDDEHVKAKSSNSVVVSLLKQVDDATNEQGDGQVTETSTDKEKNTQYDGAALAFGVAKDETEGFVALFFGAFWLRFFCRLIIGYFSVRYFCLRSLGIKS